MDVPGYYDLGQLPDTCSRRHLTLSTQAAALSRGLRATPREDALYFLRESCELDADALWHFDNRRSLHELTAWLDEWSRQNRDPASEVYASGPFRTYMALSHRPGQAARLVGELTAFHSPAPLMQAAALSTVLISYRVFPGCRGQGHAPDMINTFTAMAQRAGLAGICAEVRWDNVPSQRSLLRSGFNSLGVGPLSGIAKDDMGTQADLYMRRYMRRLDGPTARPQDWPYVAPAWMLPAPR